MSKLNKLVGEGKEVKIGEVTLDIRPLTVSSLPLLMQIGDKENKEGQAEAMKEVISRTLKDSVPDATDEEIDKISFEYIVPLMEAIMEVNNMEMDEDKKALIEKMKRKNGRHDETDGAKAGKR
ncbi:hypothetical protein LCGC14_1373610 [marine sediment metagenome]|uniref:Tail assembly chaperone n=1 Tax=marine sediment metagenome TaxID=412755 RepID=A0A0F9N6M8_9ZZZZ